MSIFGENIAQDRIFQDGAILPRERRLSLSLKPPASSHIQIFLDEKPIGEGLYIDDHWEFELPAMAAGGPHRLRFELDGTVERDIEVYFGDVFLLSGQSNMQLPISRALDACPYDTLDDPLIRELCLPHEEAWRGIAPKASWHPLSPEHFEVFSALGAAFAIHYREAHDVPVGFISTAIGGTPVASWLPPYHPLDLADLKQVASIEMDAINRWYKELETVTEPWETLEMPAMFFGTKWEDQQGAFELRYRFSLEHTNYDRLDLGGMVDHDVTYLNGKEIGTTGYQYPPRKYKIPEGLLNVGENEILVRLYVQRNTGGFVPERIYALRGAEDFSLEGAWEIRQIARQKDLPYQTFFDRMPGINWYHFTKPLGSFPFKAILWYQGESDDQETSTYKSKFTSLVKRFQKQFFAPVIFCQLPCFEDPTRMVPEGSWTRIREAQEAVSRLPHCSQVVHYDISQATDLHPEDKWTLGKRVFNHVEAFFGGQDLRGPELIVVTKDKQSVTLTYDRAVEVIGDISEEFRLASGTALKAIDVEGQLVHLDFADEIAAGDVLSYQEKAKQDCGLYANGEPASPFRRVL